VNALLRDWSALVTAVERGYDDSIYEYTNDLSVRDRLAGIEGPELAELDRRFEAATEPAARPLGERAVGWGWWRRVPRRRTGELADDLASLGYLG
jgi:hypothetical protein